MASMSAVLAALQLIIASPGAPSLAVSQAPAARVNVEDAPAPPAFLNFCIDHPEECGQDTSRIGQVRLAAAPVLTPYWQSVFARPSGSVTYWLRRSWIRESRDINVLEETAIREEAAVARVEAVDDLGLVAKVNADVNAEITPRVDREVFGDVDHWALPLVDGSGPFGDCEDFALQKRSILRKSGVSLGALSIAIVETPRRETHAVLLVNTAKGVLVLDNLTSRIRRLEQTPYRIISRESFGAPLHWKSSVQPLSAI